MVETKGLAEKWEQFLESRFAAVGRFAAKRSWLCIALSLLVCVGCASGFSKLVNESRPEKQWVPSDAPALEQNVWAQDTWPSDLRLNMWIATCAGGDETCNINDAAHLQRLSEITERIMNITIDGDALVEEWDEANPTLAGESAPWNKYKGKWRYKGKGQTLCYKTGPYCLERNILAVWGPDGSSAIEDLTDTTAVQALNSWKQQASKAFEIGSVASAGGDGAAVDAQGDYTANNAALFGYFGVANNEVFVKGRMSDPLADKWENEALCVLGIDVANKGASSSKCPEDDVLSFKPNFSRSLGDEFGNAIKGDISKLGGAYMVILVYLTVMLSRCDPVHNMVGMSLCTLVIVGMSYASAMGLGGYLGIFNNNLNQNIPFLLLGLGVDDAFVLVSCFHRARRRNPNSSIEQQIEEASRTGGISILITSITDALAFFVGAATRLPALSWFCQFAGFGVTFCFLFQLFFFLPCLAINAKRSEANRLDLLCCFKLSKKHEVDRPSGCCCKSRSVDKNGNYVDGLAGGLANFTRWTTGSVGRIVTLLIFTTLLAFGITGCLKIYKDFKIEWFIPSDSYVNNFFALNDEYFSTGTKIDVHFRDIDYFAAQEQLSRVHIYLLEAPYVDQTEGINDWFTAFSGTEEVYDVVPYTPSAPSYSNSSEFFGALHEWYASFDGARFRSSIRWSSPACEDLANTAGACDPTAGLMATKVSVTLKPTYTTSGTDSYQTMMAMRNAIDDIVPPAADGTSNAFPFSRAFLYWEENGVIDVELNRNLLLCAAVVLTIIFSMIPHPHIAVWVAFTVITAIIDMIGFLYWWGVTVSGTSVIYILISVGLAVDYSAHIAHAFASASGDAPTRAVKAVYRLGPSVFNAVVSTLLAVVLIGFSKSWVFVIFFRALFLTCLLGGACGLWLLPVLLSIFGGSSKRSDGTESDEDGFSIKSVEGDKVHPGTGGLQMT